jgi:hypothetical protein
MKNTSLKATKKTATAPSKVESILSDSVKLALAPIVSDATSAYQFGMDYEKLVMTKQEKEQVFAHSFVSYVKSNALNYSNYHATKKHIQNSIALSKKQSPETVEKWINKIVKSYMAVAKLDGYELPKAESKNAVSMNKLRTELASIDNATLSKTIETLAKAGDKDSLKKATQLASEKAKREKQAINSAKQSESKATTELKNMLKKWITGANATELATLVYVKNNFNDVTKFAKLTK